MNKRVIISLVLVALMGFGTAIGTYAWFTSTATSNNNVFTAGTLTIDVNGSSTTEGKTFDILSFDKMLPGDATDVKVLEIENTGNVNLGMFREFNMTGSNILAKQLIVTHYTINDYSGTYDLIKDYPTVWDSYDFDNDDKVTLYDLANRLDEYGNGWDALVLKPNKIQTIEIAFKLNELADNTVQGQTATLVMNVKATQINAEAIRALNLGTSVTPENLVAWFNKQLAVPENN